MKTKITFIAALLLLSITSIAQGTLKPIQRDNNKWGYVDENGEVKIPFIYTQAYRFHEGVAFVSEKGFGNGDTGFEGFIDENGKRIIDFGGKYYIDQIG